MSSIDVHEQFANYFKNEDLKPFIYLLSKKMADGHICLSLDELDLKEESIDLPPGIQFENPIDTSVFGRHLKLVSDGNGEMTPFIFDLNSNKFYLHRNYFYEKNIVKHFKRISHITTDELKSRKEKLLELKPFIQNALNSVDKDIKEFTDEEKPDWQLVAAINGFLNNLTIVTGGPGTGKTTTVAKILSLLNKFNPNLRVALAAPTGKAAVRMKESLQLSTSENKHLEIDTIVDKLDEPFTLHGLLGTIYQSPFFKHNSENPLDYDVVIVDESSMIGLAMLAKLLDSIGENTRLILLGDSEQLSSVDIGSMFGDICFSQKTTENKFTKTAFDFFNGFLATERLISEKYLLEKKSNFLNEHLIRLKKTYRYKQDQKLGIFTKAIINGEKDNLEEILKLNDESIELYDISNSKIIYEFTKQYEDYIKEDDIVEAIKKFNKLRVLCAVKLSDQGVYKMNEKIERLLKNSLKDNPKLFNPSGDCYHNQPIIVRKNQRDLNLSNGDTGIIRRSKKHDNRLIAFFPIKTMDSKGMYFDDVFTVNPGFISEYQTVFAMTIHKSQGSEYNKVLVVLPKNSENRILTRELLYTGITRAKTKAIILGSMEVLKKTVGGKVQRTSGLCNLIQNEI